MVNDDRECGTLLWIEMMMMMQIWIPPTRIRISSTPERGGARKLTHRMYNITRIGSNEKHGDRRSCPSPPPVCAFLRELSRGTKSPETGDC